MAVAETAIAGCVHTTGRVGARIAAGAPRREAASKNGVCQTTNATNATNNLVTPNSHWYRSSRRDQTSSQYQFGSRTYDPGKNSWLTPDTHRTGTGDQNLSVGTDPLTANTYGYVNGDPINLRDPSGHIQCRGGRMPDGGCETKRTPGFVWRHAPSASPQPDGGARDTGATFVRGDPLKLRADWLLQTQGGDVSFDLEGWVYGCAGPGVNICHKTGELANLNPELSMSDEDFIYYFTAAVTRELAAGNRGHWVFDVFDYDYTKQLATETEAAIKAGWITDVSQGVAGTAVMLKNLIASLRGTTRLARDAALDLAPPALPTSGRSIGRASHNQALQADLANLPPGARDIRVNQQQVNAAGQRVGLNRPDLQYTDNGQRYYIEYEGVGAPRGPSHTGRILANDPTGIVIVSQVP